MYSLFLDKVQLPVMPQKIALKISNQNKTVSLINGEEINILKAPGLTEINFDALLPNVRYPFAVYPDGFKKAEYYLGMLESAKTGKKPVRFIISRISPGGNTLNDTNMLVSLEDYDITEDAKEGLDVTMSVKLKQYRSYGTKTAQIVLQKATPTIKSAPPQRPVTKTSAKTYTVKKGDCLWNICKKQLGNGSKCYAIAKLNNIKNPNLIRAGQVIRLA